MISNQGSSWNQNPLHSARPDEVDAESIHNTIGRGYGSTHGGERGMGSAVTINRYGTYNSHNSNLNKFGSISSATSSVLFHGASTASNVNIHHGHKIPSTNIDEASSVDNNIVFASSTATRYAPTTATNTTNTTFMKSRREFKNTTHGGLLTIALFIDRTTHVAGGEVTGRLEVYCRSGKRVKLGNIEVEIQGFEEILDVKSPHKEEPKSRCFLNEVVVFQSLKLAPSDAVVGGTPDEHGMRLARKRTTVFDFKINLGGDAASSLPSSFWSRKYGGIRYVISGVLEAKINNGNPGILKTNREVFVVERCPIYQSLEFPIVAPEKALVVSESKEVVVRSLFSKTVGEVTLIGRVHVPEVEGGVSAIGSWTAGGLGFVGVEISNNGGKKVTFMKISLVRRLKTFSESLKPITFNRLVVCHRSFVAQGGNSSAGHASAGGDAKYAQGGGWWTEEDSGIASDTVVGEWWDGVAGGMERMMVVDMNIPSWVRSVRNTSMMEVSFVVNVSLQVAGGCRLEVEIPVTVLHPASFYSALPTLFINRNSSGRVEYGGVIEDKKEVDEVLDAEEKEDELDRDALHQFGIKELSHEATVVRGPTALQPPNAPPAMPANSLFSSSHSPRKQRLVVSDQEEKIIERYGTVRLAPVPPSPQPPHPDSLPVAPVLLKRNNTLPRNHGNNQYAKPPPPPPPPAPPVMTFFPPPTPLEQAPVLIRRGKESIDAVIAHARQKHETAEKKLSAVTLTSAFGGNSDDDDEEVVVVDKEEQEEDEGEEEEEEMPVLHEVAGRKLLERQETLTNDRIRISAAKATSSGADKRKGLSLEDESLFQSLNAMLSNI